jgi:hypothetical protein
MALRDQYDRTETNDAVIAASKSLRFPTIDQVADSYGAFDGAELVSKAKLGITVRINGNPDNTRDLKVGGAISIKQKFHFLELVNNSSSFDIAANSVTVRIYKGVNV